jgi:hypothetical protein
MRRKYLNSLCCKNVCNKSIPVILVSPVMKLWFSSHPEDQSCYVCVVNASQKTVNDKASGDSEMTSCHNST